MNTNVHITMRYAFVLHCCDVMALCTASQIAIMKHNDRLPEK